MIVSRIIAKKLPHSILGFTGIGLLSHKLTLIIKFSKDPALGISEGRVTVGCSTRLMVLILAYAWRLLGLAAGLNIGYSCRGKRAYLLALAQMIAYCLHDWCGYTGLSAAKG